MASPEKIPWVAQARTLLAPLLTSSSAALQRVPAVSIMSSTMMMFLPSTSPMAVMEPTTLARSRVLWQMITEASSSPGVGVGPLGPSHVGRGYREVLDVEALDIGDEHLAGVDVVEGYVEEALDLFGVEVAGHHPVGAGGAQKVGHELGAYGDAGRSLRSCLAQPK